MARVIASLGGDVEALFVAGGEIGQLLDRLLEAEGITRHLIPIAGQTRIGFVVQEQTTGLEYRFVPEGPAVLPEEIELCMDSFVSHRATYVVASGSLPFAAASNTYARMADMTASRGAKFVLDSSGPGLQAALESSRVFLVKPSLGELEKLVGQKLGDDNMRAAAVDLVERGAAEIVVVTLGADGALLATSGGVLRVPAVPVRMRSAVGAGDSFLGAMVLALSQGKSTEEAFRFGVAAGAAKVMTPGTRPCQRDDVWDLLAKVESGENR